MALQLQFFIVRETAETVSWHGKSHEVFEGKEADLLQALVPQHLI